MPAIRHLRWAAALTSAPLLLAAAAMLLLGAELPVPGAPKLVCPEMEFDFGRTLNSNPVKHAFVLKNEGTAPLEIKNVHTSCGCTAVTPASKTIAPGASTELAVQLSLHGKTGLMHKTITVVTNDPEQPKVTLALKGTAFTHIQVQPPSVVWDTISADTETKQMVEISAGTPEISFNITGVENTSPQVAAEVEAVEPGKKYRLTIRTKPPLSEGLLNAIVRMQTDHPEHKVIPVAVRGKVAGPLVVRPEVLFIAMPQVSPGPLKRLISIAPGSVKQFKILEVRPPLPTIQTAISEKPNGVVIIELNGIEPSPDLNGKEVLIKTDAPSLPEIKVPFKVETLPAAK